VKLARAQVAGALLLALLALIFLILRYWAVLR
jgi:hypothetical protein